MRKLVTGMTFGVLSQLAAVGLLLTSGWLIVRAAEQPPVLYLMIAIVGVRFFGLTRALLRYVERLLTHDVAFDRTTDARVAAYRELDRAAPRTVGGSRRGDLIARVVSDVEAVQDRLLRVRAPWVSALAAVVVVVALVAWIDPWCGLAVGLGAGVPMLATRTLVPWLTRRAAGDELATRGELGSEVSQAVLVAPDLVAHGSAGLVAGPAHRAIDAMERSQRRAAVVSGLASALVLVGAGLAMAAVALLSGDLDPVLTGVAVLAPLALVEPVDALADAERLRPTVEASHRRLAELAETADPVAGGGSAPLPVDATLVAHDLVAGWDAPLTSPASFTLAPGQALALTGPSGVGKSTLALTLARLLDPLAGTVTLGGADVGTLDPADVRSVVGRLAQDEVVLDTTLRENLRVGRPDTDDDAMRDALRRAGLSRFVAALPLGLDTPVGERGSLLSGGERQRLCVARLLLAGHRVLVVDEPTEHLDRAAADALVEDLLALTASGHSLLVITHARHVVDRIGREVVVEPAARPVRA